MHRPSRPLSARHALSLAQTHRRVRHLIDTTVVRVPMNARQQRTERNIKFCDFASTEKSKETRNSCQ